MGVCPCGVWYPVWSSWWQWWLTRAPRALNGSRSSSWLHLESRMTVAKQMLQSGGELQTLPLCLPADKQVGSVGQLHWPSVRISLCSSCCKLVATLSFKSLRFLYPSWSPCHWGYFPGYRKLSSLIAPSQVYRSHPDSFLSFFFSFVSLRYKEILLPFQMSEILCQHSVDILWESFHM